MPPSKAGPGPPPERPARGGRRARAQAAPAEPAAAPTLAVPFAAEPAPTPPPQPLVEDGPRHITLALQGGGSHGAFTWGVIDRLLEDPRIRIEAISGTSAGAMNAIVTAQGLTDGGEAGARAALRAFWTDVARAGAASPIRRGPLDMLLGRWSLDASPGYVLFDLLSRVASPYDVNPLNLNPLRQIIERHVRIDSVRACRELQIFISATSVHTGRVQVFTGASLSIDAVLASACLPLLFQAVEIDGVPHWDGGFTGNPVLFPFYSSCRTEDIVIVQINPVERLGTPTSAAQILNRMNEITFNASLLSELRAIDFVSRLHDWGRLEGLPYRKMRMHLIEGASALGELGASSKMNSEMDFLEHLFEIGRERAGVWLDAAWPSLGRESTLDLRAMFEGKGAVAGTAPGVLSAG